MALINQIGAKNVVIYFVIINILAFLIMGIDKLKAKKGKWRIPESTLMSSVLLGGGIGGIAGMYVFHHKTRKHKFFIGYPVILIIEVIAIIYLILNT